MSGWYRLRKLIVRGFLIGCLIGVGLAFSQEDCRASDGQPKRQISYEVANNHVRTPTYSGGFLSNLKSKDPCESAQDREDRDLCQQWRMAQAAESQADWTKAQFWITFAEVIGLVLVVTYTAKTARDAGRSAAAAEATVKVSQETAERQLRAYIHCEMMKFMYFGDQIPKVHFTIKNYGQTPAYGLQSTFVMKYTEASQEMDTPSFDDPHIKWESLGDVAPGAFIGSLIEVNQPSLTSAQRQNLIQGRAAFYIAGMVIYSDAFKRPRDLRYKFVFGGGLPLDSEYNFALCKTGNKAT